MGDAEEEIDLPTPTILKPVRMWTGKQIFNLMIKPNKKCHVNVNLEMKEKNYDTKADAKHLCKNDGWVCFRNSELISGNIAKKTIGDGSKVSRESVILLPRQLRRYFLHIDNTSLTTLFPRRRLVSSTPS